MVSTESMSLTANDAERRAFWADLCPKLSLEGQGAATPPPAPAPALGELGTHLSNLKVEGYLQAENAFSPEVIVPVREAVATLAARNIPLPFIFVFDEPWALFQAMRPLLEHVLGKGYKALPDFWVWFVPTKDGAAGWGPHRDRVQPTVERDNSPRSLTVWLALSDATAENGCMHILPAHLDERFKRRVWDGDDNNVVYEPQNIRALPVPSGTLMAWNQAVLHWGGRSSRLAKAPRVSAAFEFQRGDRPAYNTPLLDPGRTPTFEERLGLVGKQVLQYQHMYPLSPDVARIATTLRDRFMPGAALK